MMEISKSHIWLCFIPWIFLNNITIDIAEAGNGAWSKWTEWDSCSTTCGQGNQRRYRACDNPPPTKGGKWCPGSVIQVQSCDQLECPENGGWSNWSDWAPCSTTCGEGQHSRSRSCTNPEPKFGGYDCAGESLERESCKNMENCPRDGGWSTWSTWTSCSVTCGQGIRQKFRTCTNPQPAADGRPCEGTPQKTANCNADTPCPINGQWSEWTDWSSCSTTCGPGQQRRARSCDNPPAQHGGLPCNDSEAGHIQVKPCQASIHHCPVNGDWSDWSEWGPCETRDCETKNETAVSLRLRSCNSPLPKHGGTMCQGSFLKAGICPSATNCKVDGGWNDWSQWICTENVAKRTRECNNPSPKYGGKPCPTEDGIEIYSKSTNPEKFDEFCGEDEEKQEQSSDSNDDDDEEEEEAKNDKKDSDDWLKDYDF